ncbi:MAG TPA: AAA family ATPase [Rhabdochlamydiaceae bacterium]|nr:AAA family ATPase [Rhabdochlamydiaceae bacterium]
MFLAAAAAPLAIVGVSALFNKTLGQPGNLNSTTVNLVELARKDELRGRCFGRDSILTKLSSMLGTKRGFYILSGPAGTGKTAIVEELAHRIAEDSLPQLKNARILRLVHQHVRPQHGLMGGFREMLYGSVSSTLENLIEELSRANTKSDQSEKPVTILFIDEIHEILRHRPDIIMQHKERLDQYGVIIVGATTDDKLVSDFAKVDEAAGRRLTELKVSPMSPQEAIESFSTGIAKGGLAKSTSELDVDKSAIEAIVYLSDYSTHKSKPFPDKGIKFLEEVCSYASGKGDTSVNIDTVIEYLARTASCKRDELQKVFREKTTVSELNEQFFKTHFTLLKEKKSKPYWPLKNFSQYLKRRSDDACALIVKTNSQVFLRQAASSFSTADKPIYRISVQNLINMQQHQNIVPFLKRELARLGNVTLLLEDANPLLCSLAGGIRPTARVTSSSSASPSLPVQVQNMIPDLGGVLLQMTQNAGQQLGLLPSGAATSASSNQLKPPSGQDSPIIKALLDDWISKEKSCLIAALPKDEQAASGLQERWSVFKMDEALLSATDTINWLSAQVDKADADWIEKVVFLSYELWNENISTSPSDLSHDCFKKVISSARNTNPLMRMAHLPNKVNPLIPLFDAFSSNKICEALVEVSGGFIKLEQATSALRLFSTIQAPVAKRTDLHQFSQQLGFLVDEVQTASSLLKIEESDLITREYLSSLIKQHMKGKGNTFVADFSQIKASFKSPASQEAYLEIMAQHAKEKGKTPTLIVCKEEMTGGVEQLFKRLHGKGFSMICFTPPQKERVSKNENDSDEEKDSSFAGQLMQRGARLIGGALPAATQVQPTAWVDSILSVFVSKTFTKEQFDLFCEDLIKENFLRLNLNDEQLDSMERSIEALKCTYYLIYSQENHGSIARISSALKRDLPELYPANKPLNTDFKHAIDFLHNKYGENFKISKEDILYEVDPSSVSHLYKLKRLVIKVTSVVKRAVIAPFAFVWKEIGGGIKGAVGWMTGNTIFTFVRRTLVGI